MSLSRVALVAGGALLVLASLFIPPGWFIPLPRNTAPLPPPISGFTLVQITLFIEGLVLMWLGLRRWPQRESSAAAGYLLPDVEPQPKSEPHLEPGPEPDLDPRLSLWLLAAISLLGLVLRIVSLGNDLWIDELTPVTAYRNASWMQVAVTYTSSNNHLLNTLLVNTSIRLFGQSEWAIRLPAMLWGTATIPALYWVARQALSRYASLSAALLLAVSYHHIFFSQNARGYSAYLFLSLVSSVLLVKALSTDRRRTWVAFVATTLLNFAALLISGFVFAAHVIVGGLAVLTIKGRGGPWRPLLQRLVWIFGLIAFLGFQMYAAVVPQMYMLMRSVYTESTSGFSLFSLELVAELTRGLTAGFGTGLLLGAIPFLALAVAGYVILVRRHWILALALTLPCLLQAVLIVVQGLTFSPRFFILALPLAIMVVVQALTSATSFVARGLRQSDRFAWWCRTAGVVVLCVASIAALPRYYTVPKQPYRAALAFVETARQPGSRVIVIHYASAGMRYYLERTGTSDADYDVRVRTLEALDTVMAEEPGRPVWLVTTFPRALRLGVPDLDARIKRDWEIVRTFPATIGDGQILVWRQKP